MSGEYPDAATARGAICGNHPTVWHILRGQAIGDRVTLCGHWPDTFANAAMLRDEMPVCRNCRRRLDALREVADAR